MKKSNHSSLEVGVISRHHPEEVIPLLQLWSKLQQLLPWFFQSSQSYKNIFLGPPHLKNPLVLKRLKTCRSFFLTVSGEHQEQPQGMIKVGQEGHLQKVCSSQEGRTGWARQLRAMLRSVCFGLERGEHFSHHTFTGFVNDPIQLNWDELQVQKSALPISTGIATGCNYLLKCFPQQQAK